MSTEKQRMGLIWVRYGFDMGPIRRNHGPNRLSHCNKTTNIELGEVTQ